MKNLNRAVTGTLIFILGAATGSLVAWKMAKTKYERVAQEDIDAYRAYADRRIAAARGEETTEKASEEDTDESDTEGDPMEPLSDLIGRYRSDDDRKEIKPVNGPYVIPPEEYGEHDGYDCSSLTYYADGVLTDEWDNVINDPDDLVGEDFATHFGEYEADSIFIRNDAMERDFEILRDLEAFGDISGVQDRSNDAEE